MRVLMKDGLIVLVPVSAEEADDVERWKSAYADHVFHVRVSPNAALELHGLGTRADACREPVNIVSNSPDPTVRLISNFAATPFDLEGKTYRSVESFWQGLKFPDEADRRRLAQLDGARARAEGETQGYGATIAYGGHDIPVGTWPHWQLMETACRAKFEQNGETRAALLATGDRPLTHIVRRDSRTIPGAIMAAIWMCIRADLRRR